MFNSVAVTGSFFGCDLDFFGDLAKGNDGWRIAGGC
jgi:hypothetical protein